MIPKKQELNPKSPRYTLRTINLTPCVHFWENMVVGGAGVNCNDRQRRGWSKISDTGGVSVFYHNSSETMNMFVKLRICTWERGGVVVCCCWYIALFCTIVVTNEEGPFPIPSFLLLQHLCHLCLLFRPPAASFFVYVLIGPNRRLQIQISVQAQVAVCGTTPVHL